MEDSQMKDKLSLFMESGLYFFEDSNAVFIDPVRVLNRSYTGFRVSHFSYYTRFLESERAIQDSIASSTPRKRKRTAKELRPLNERERIADQRHREARPLLLKAHESLLKSTGLLNVMRNLRNDHSCSTECGEFSLPDVQHSFIGLGKVWQAPLYEITLNLRPRDLPDDGEVVGVRGDTMELQISIVNPKCVFSFGFSDSAGMQCCEQMVLPAFNNLVANETKDDAEAEFLKNCYIIPRESCFYMSDLEQIHNLIPAHADSGFSLIVIDPPWENASARQKLRYPTLPNRYFFSLPIKQLTHTEGALVALWVTNREKLRSFVENELFPAWGVSYVADFYWLKVKPNGSMICDIDLFHHRPYESLILGYSYGKVTNPDIPSKFKPVKDNQVIMSIPGDYSRKPPIADLLMEYVPGLKPGRYIELFAREMMAGCFAWGNEPLHFQDRRYFVKI